MWRAVAASGVTLLAVAVLLYAARVANARVWVAIAVSGAAILMVAAAANRGTVASFLRRRDARRGADAVLGTLFLAAILVVLQATSVHRSHTFDLTRNQRHTLAPQTVALLDSLDRDVTVTGFFRQASPKRDGAEQLLSLYAQRSPRFRYTMADPDRQPDLARRLGASLDVMVVEAGTDRRAVNTISEESLTHALLSLTRSGPRVAYFVTGHGEKDISVSDREGYSGAKQGLESQGYAVRPLSLFGGARVPDDCAVLVIAGPRRDYFDDELGVVGRYLEDGGSALFMIDPRTETSRLSSLLLPLHLALVDAVVLDTRSFDAGDRAYDATVAKVRRYLPHPITTSFNFTTLFPRACPVVIADDSTVAGLDARYLCITDDTSWGETDFTSFSVGRAVRDGVDVAGPLPIAAAASKTRLVGESGHAAPGVTSRVVLIGDSDFANNAMYGVLGNSDFFLNAMAFLSEDDNLIRIRPRRMLEDTVYITERQGRMVFLVCLVLLPLAPVVAGAVVVARRRRL